MYVDGHYQTCDVDIWKKYRLLAVDGSTAEVPNSDEIVQDWGVFKVRADGKNICMARTLQVFDPLNRIVVRAAIDKFERSETELFKELLPQISSMEGYGNLWIFNRYFASLELIFRLDGLGDQFCFRMKKDWWKVCESFYKSGEQSRIITITLNKKKAEELTKIGAHAPACVA